MTSTVIQGYAKIKDGKVYLGFSKEAPIFEHAPGSKLFELVEANVGTDIVGYSVIKETEGRYGLLYYPDEKGHAERMTARFIDEHKVGYKCIPLKLKDDQS